MRRPARKCLFCGGEKLSKEHIWSNWARDLLPASQGYLELTNPQPRRGRSGERIVRDDQGSITGRRIKRVCKPCNNGWMSRLETEARDTVTALIRGTHQVLTLADQASLLRWVTTKLMVLDALRDGESVFLVDERRAFFEKGLPPADLAVWLLHCGDGDWKTMFWSQAQGLTMGASDSVEKLAPPPRGTPNVKLFVWGVGQALLAGVYARDIGLSFEMQDDFAVPLWPSRSESQHWPPKGRIDGTQARSLMSTLQNLGAQSGVRLVDLTDAANDGLD